MAGETRQPRVLCLDGGGSRGLSEILILKELMLQVQIRNGLDFRPEPSQCFDFICGTSTGGLNSVLLGRLGKTLDQCETLFRQFSSKIFSGSSAWRATRLTFVGSKHSSAGLTEVIRQQAGDGMMHERDPSANGHLPVRYILPGQPIRIVTDIFVSPLRLLLSQYPKRQVTAICFGLTVFERRTKNALSSTPVELRPLLRPFSLP